MSIPTFDKSLLIEQIRFIESQTPLSCPEEIELADLSKHQDFQQRLWERARCLVKHHELLAVVSHATGSFRYFKILGLILAAVFGVLGTVYAITDSQTINIYWLLLVLLGFNFISIVLWLVGITLNLQGLSAGVLARVTAWLPRWFDHKNHASKHKAENNTALADRAWLSCSLNGKVGKWQLSVITHQLWLIYLLAGLIALILLLMVRQYDFVWGTTLLSDTAFVSLTETLGRPMESFGFVAPTTEQVMASRLGSAVELNAQHRASWAQFLLGSLLCFGILPRLVFLLWSSIMHIRARNRFTPDWYLPYYITLRQRLMPLASHGHIVDADSAPPADTQSTAATSKDYPVPESAQWVAVELGNRWSWPLSMIQQDANLGEVVDRESQASALDLMKMRGCRTLAVAVDAARSPDRGLQRSICNLVSNVSQPYLVLLQSTASEEIPSQRLDAWYRLAQACDIPAEQLVSLNGAKA